MVSFVRKITRRNRFGSVQNRLWYNIIWRIGISVDNSDEQLELCEHLEPARKEMRALQSSKSAIRKIIKVISSLKYFVHHNSPYQYQHNTPQNHFTLQWISLRTSLSQMMASFKAAAKRSELALLAEAIGSLPRFHRRACIHYVLKDGHPKAPNITRRVRNRARFHRTACIHEVLKDGYPKAPNITRPVRNRARHFHRPLLPFRQGKSRTRPTGKWETCEGNDGEPTAEEFFNWANIPCKIN